MRRLVVSFDIESRSSLDRTAALESANSTLADDALILMDLIAP